MEIDEELLRDCLQAREALQRVEAELARTRGAFERSVRRLYVEGASTREIAEALDLSHQRIHQLVGAAPRSWLQRVFGIDRTPAQGCSFCARRAKQVSRLVAGPGVQICDRCIGAAERAVGVAKDAGAIAPFRRLPEASLKRCSFCGRRKRGTARVSARGHQICSECVHFARAIAAGERA